MADLIDRIELMRQIAEFGREIPKDQVMEVIARMPTESSESEKHQLSEEIPTNTPTDLISRQDVYCILEKMMVDRPLATDRWVIRDIDKAIKSLPSADRPSDEEDKLKFYYVESIDDYWIGMRIDNFYYADWHEGLGFVWSKSRYLPWGEHIVDENTLWKEHTYPSEPIEIFFTKWIVGFVKKYFAYRPKGDWINENGTYYANCSKCGYQMDTHQERGYFRYCPNCGSRMK